MTSEIQALMMFPFEPAWDPGELLTEIARALRPALTRRGLEVGVRLREAISKHDWGVTWLWYLEVRAELAWYERVLFDKYFSYLHAYEQRREKA